MTEKGEMHVSSIETHLLRVPRALCVYYCGRWTYKSDVTGPQTTISGKKMLAQARRRWHWRGFRER